MDLSHAISAPCVEIFEVRLCYFAGMIPAHRGVPQCTRENFERDFAGRHLLHQVIAWWAGRKPHDPAIISYDRGQAVDWLTLDRVSTDLALALFRLGFRKGDFLAAALPMSLEHIFLEYACFKTGVIHVPLDLRLRAPEVVRCLEMLKPKGFAYLVPDLASAAKANCPWIEHWFAQADLAEMIAKGPSPPSSSLQSAFAEAMAAVGENDGAQVIFTTGSTGSPKAALLSHRNITCQNMCLGSGFGFAEERILLNLPPSHVGGQAEVLMTALYWGGTVVTLQAYDPAKSLDAVQKYGVTMLGQVPSMFQFEWRLSEFSGYDLSSLRKVVYGGQQVSRQFLERMAQMAPMMATGLGLTETAGFCTYTPMTPSVDEVMAGLGHDMPVFAMSIRREMKEDGAAGDPLPEGEVGNICFCGPQTFLGYVNDPASTAKTVSADGYLYTGDLGWKDDEGLHFSGRAKWVIKPAGYQVFPGDVESHFCALHEMVAACGAVGAEHRLLSEAIVVFVEKKPGADLSVGTLKHHARTLASYMRPFHYVLLEPGQMPLNRAAKIDYVRLSELARQEVDSLRSKGRWDRG
ncbi:MAG: acyl--CoA ligase [Acidobacteriia bacterium]|nr:acyl--CoA ligase [Terriglobia bacterium]